MSNLIQRLRLTCRGGDGCDCTQHEAADLNEVVRWEPFQSIADVEGPDARFIAASRDGRWVCSAECYDRAVEPATPAVQAAANVVLDAMTRAQVPPDVLRAVTIAVLHAIAGDSK